MEFRQNNRIYRLSNDQNIDVGIDGNFSFVIFVSDSDWLGNGNNQKALFFLNSFRIVGEPPGPSPKPAPTSTPRPGEPATVSLALTTNLSEDNGDGTLTTVIAATVADAFGAPVADGVRIDFSVLAPTKGAVISDADTNGGPSPECNLIQFQARTGVPIINQPGKAYACLTYPREQSEHDPADQGYRRQPVHRRRERRSDLHQYVWMPGRHVSAGLGHRDGNQLLHAAGAHSGVHTPTARPATTSTRAPQTTSAAVAPTSASAVPTAASASAA